MSNDRVMTQNPTKCCAFGCPMPGAMTQSTVGTNEWFCWLHFGKESVHWQAITSEINRLSWLADAITSMRRDYMRDQWPETYKYALHTIRANQRKDLEKLKDEPLKQWWLRLDKVLSNACFDVAKAPVKQARIPNNNDTWNKVNFELPETV